MPSSVTVSNIGPGVTEQDLLSLFNFCGRIESVELPPDSVAPRTATVTFQHEAAAKSARILSGVVVGPTAVNVTASTPEPTPQSSSPSSHAYRSELEVPQEHKTYRRLAVEVIAHGYAMTSDAIRFAIDQDNKYGLSRGLGRYLKTLDDKFKAQDKAAKAQERARELDSKYDVSGQLNNAWKSYVIPLTKSASETAMGVKLRTFYDDVVKTEVDDVLREAKWLREQRGAQACQCQSGTSACICAPGKCSCSSCPKREGDNSEKSCCQPSSQRSAASCGCTTAGSACVCPAGKCACSKAGGSKDCGCSSVAADCPCPSGKCACVGCPKNAAKDCGCSSSAEKCPCPAGQCECVGCPKNAAKDCGCSASAEKCGCPDGQCACEGCPKQGASTCGCGQDASKCTCPAGKCACAGCA